MVPARKSKSYLALFSTLREAVYLGGILLFYGTISGRLSSLEATTANQEKKQIEMSAKLDRYQETILSYFKDEKITNSRLAVKPRPVTFLYGGAEITAANQE